MKTRLSNALKVGGAISLVALLGCANQSAQQEPPRTVIVTPPPAPVVASAPVVVTSPAPIIMTRAAPPTTAAPALTTNVVDSPDPEIERRVDQAPPPAETRISPAAAEIVKMAQAGVNEDVMLSYIENTQQPFNLTSDGVVYLNDLGITASVITGMIKRDGQLNPASTNLAVTPEAPSITQTQIVSNVPATTVLPAQPAPPVVAAQPPPQPEAQTVYVTPPAQEVQVSYFYDTLSPYGSWLYVSGYGWCWQPTVAVNYGGWRPYCDAGRWYWSDSGWYWHSDYSWGWAPFHYGRWFHHGHAGWIWSPDTVWGPSWVSWRYTQGYCGWAPLPPGAYWSAGGGFSWRGRHVGVDCDFGLFDIHFAWVQTHRFTDNHVYRYCEPPGRTRAFFAHSTPMNVYDHRGGGPVNHGIGRDTIAKYSANEIRTVSVREQPSAKSMGSRVERMQKEGSSLVVYRPQLPKAPPAVPATLVNRSNPEQAKTAYPRTGDRPGSAAVSKSPSAPATVSPGVSRFAAEPATRTPRASVNSAPAIKTPSPSVSVAPSAPAASKPVIQPGNKATIVAPSRTSPRNEAPAAVGRPSASVASPKFTPAPRVTIPSQLAPSVPRTAPKIEQAVPRTYSPPAVTSPSSPRVETRVTPPARSFTPSAPAAPSVRPVSPFHQSAPVVTPAAPRYTPAPTRQYSAPTPAPAPRYSAPAPAPSPSRPSSSPSRPDRDRSR